MAFQSMMNGSECSTGASPLSSLLKQQNTDSSLHGSSFSQGGPASTLRSRQGIPGQGHEEAERFFQSQSNGGGGGGGPGGAFAMEGLRRELEGANMGAMKGDRGECGHGFVRMALMAVTAQNGPRSIIPLDRAWTLPTWRRWRSSSGSSNRVAATSWVSRLVLSSLRHRLTTLACPSPGEYWRQQQQSSAGPSFSQAPEAQAGFAPAYGAYGGMQSRGMGSMGMGMGSMGMGMRGMGMGGMGMMGGGMNQGYGMASQLDEQEQVGKGKGRIVELDDADWEAQFAKAGEAATKEEADFKRPLPETVNLLDGDIALDAGPEDAELMASLEKTWENLQSTLNNSSLSDAEMAAWEAQYGSQYADLNGDSGLGDDMNYNGLNDVNAPRPWTRENVDAFLANETPYPFAAENAFLDHPDPYAEGQRLLFEGAPLSQAALAFEAACQLDNGRAEAWKAAGETWAADEREVKGIRALEKAVACGGPDGVGAWMVSPLPVVLSFPATDDAYFAVSRRRLC
jgi:peroxin-5